MYERVLDLDPTRLPQPREPASPDPHRGGHTHAMEELYPVTVESADSTSVFDPTNERIRA